MRQLRITIVYFVFTNDGSPGQPMYASDPRVRESWGLDYASHASVTEVTALEAQPPPLTTKR